MFIASPAIATTGPVNDDQKIEASVEVEKTENAENAVEVPEEAPVEEVAELEAAGVEVVAYGVNADGDAVLITTDDSSEAPQAARALESFAQQVGAEDELIVQTVAIRPVAFAANDVVGGAGYLSASASSYLGYCSVGFTAWSADYEPIILSAGHCTGDGAAIDAALTDSTEEPANGGSGGAPIAFLGDFGFSQFGGIGNAPIDPNDFNPDGSLKPGAEPDPEATDISVIEDIDLALNLLPEVTTWENASDLSADTVKVKSAGGNPAVAAVQKSGRTTGFTEGVVSGTDIVDGWTIIEDRWVRGFQSNVPAAPGDSGGAVLQGTRALGVISGGIAADDNNGVQFTWAASLDRALPHLPEGTEVALDIDAPTVSIANGASVAGGSQIIVSAPSNATSVSIMTGPSSGDSAQVVDGQVVLTAPSTPGDYSWSFAAANGKSFSASVDLDFSVTLGAPTVNNVDSTATSVTLTGTGAAGAEITLAGDITGTTEVDETGNWTFPTDLEIGEYGFTVKQELNGQESSTVNGSVIVRPVALEVTSIENGKIFAHDAAPSEIAGTGIPGAAVALTINGVAYQAEVDENGAWSISFSAALVPGDYSVSAVQTVNGVNSPATALSFNVAADPSNSGGNAGTGGSGDTAAGGNGGLPNTGGETLMPLGISALLMLLLGAGLFAFTARRNKANAEI